MYNIKIYNTLVCILFLEVCFNFLIKSIKCFYCVASAAYIVKVGINTFYC